LERVRCAIERVRAGRRLVSGGNGIIARLYCAPGKLLLNSAGDSERSFDPSSFFFEEMLRSRFSETKIKEASSI
jgi:hypothetical protein